MRVSDPCTAAGGPAASDGTAGRLGRRRHGTARHWAIACGLIGLAAGAPAAAGSQAAAAQPQASTRQVTIAITGMSPQIAQPGQQITVSGIVSNTLRETATDLSVQLRSSPDRLTSRGDLANYAAGDLADDVPIPGAEDRLPGSLKPGATRHWKISVPVSSIGMSTFGVYPLAVEVDSSGVPATAVHTFLPFWPGTDAAGLAGRLQLSWIWPLIGQPQQGPCPALLSNSLAASLPATGRLGGLLAAGSSSAGRSADLTWAIDPSLLASVKSMTQRYGTGGNAVCGGVTSERADPAARQWLTSLTSVTTQQDFFTTPYADVDVAALSHAGMATDLSRAYAEGKQEANRVLGSAQQPPAQPAGDKAQAGKNGTSPTLGMIAWPADGIADYGVLGSLAVDGVGTVVLDSTMMPPLSAPSFTPSAVTQTLDGVGPELHVALADDSLTQILAAAPTPAAAARGGTAAGATFTTAQRFLAETAMIAAEAPALRRTVVVAPPREWDPAPGLASDLLGETVSAPWLQPTSLASLVSSTSATGQVTRKQPPQQDVAPKEVSGSLLRQVQAAQSGIAVQGSILGTGSGYLSRAVASVESAAWRGDPAQAERLLGQLSGYVQSQQQKITILHSAQVTLSGQSGPVPVSIRNLLRRSITVRIQAQAPAGRLAITPFNRDITIGSHQQRTVPLRVKALVNGSTLVRLSLLSPSGRQLPGSTVQLTVNATHLGTLALVIIAIACGVFVLTSIIRAIRRGLSGPEPVTGHDAGPDDDENGADHTEAPTGTDTVVSRTDHGNTPEEPDEYASAPARVERT